jgi:hypothetical protein
MAVKIEPQKLENRKTITMLQKQVRQQKKEISDLMTKL